MKPRAATFQKNPSCRNGTVKSTFKMYYSISIRVSGFNGPLKGQKCFQGPTKGQRRPLLTRRFISRISFHLCLIVGHRELFTGPLAERGFAFKKRALARSRAAGLSSLCVENMSIYHQFYLYSRLCNGMAANLDCGRFKSKCSGIAKFSLKYSTEKVARYRAKIWHGKSMSQIILNLLGCVGTLSNLLDNPFS